jgi:hypothetical protein
MKQKADALVSSLFYRETIFDSGQAAERSNEHP